MSSESESTAALVDTMMNFSCISGSTWVELEVIFIDRQRSHLTRPEQQSDQQVTAGTSWSSNDEFTSSVLPPPLQG